MQLLEEDRKPDSRPTVPAFVETSVYRRITAKVALLGKLGGLGYIIGPTGLGKTTILRQLARRGGFEHPDGLRPSTAYWRCSGSERDKKAIVGGVRDAFGLREYVPRHVFRELREYCAGGSGAVFLLVDEAQHLTRGAISLLRTMSDDGLRVVLCGNRSTLGERFTWGTNDFRSEAAWDDEWAQISSRSVFTVELDKPAREDVLALVTGAGVPASDRAALSVLWKVSQSGEGLRRVATLLRTALEDPDGYPYRAEHLMELWDEQQRQSRPRGLA